VRVLIPLATAVAVICALAGLAALAVIAVILDAYWISLVVHPSRQCISCGGSKRHHAEGSLNSRRCWTCGGRGEYPRIGVKLFRRGVYDAIKAGKHGRNW